MYRYFYLTFFSDFYHTFHLVTEAPSWKFSSMGYICQCIGVKRIQAKSSLQKSHCSILHNKYQYCMGKRNFMDLEIKYKYIVGNEKKRNVDDDLK